MGKYAVSWLLALVLASSGWAQSTIDDKIRQEQQALANPALPQSVKVVAQGRLAKLQQAKAIQEQIDATQQYLNASSDLSSEDRTKIVQTLQQLEGQMNSLLPQTTTASGQAVGSALPRAPAAPAASPTPVSPATGTAGVASGQPGGNAGSPPSSSAGHVADTSATHNAQPALASPSSPPLPADADSKVLDKTSLQAALQNAAVKSTVSADAQSLVRAKNGQFSQFAMQLALVTILAAMYPVDMASATGDIRELLQRKVNVQTETERSDKQLTAPPGNSGSTSGIEKPGIPLLLGFALANGSVQQQTSGTGLTLSTSPYAIAAALGGGDTDANYKKYSAYERLGLAATFNVQGLTNPDPTQLSRRQLENWSAKLRLTPDRSTRSQGFLDEFMGNKPIYDGLGAEAVALNQLLTTLEQDPTVVSAAFDFATKQNAWFTKFMAENSGKSDADLQTAVEQQIFAHLQTDLLPLITNMPVSHSQAFKDGVANLVAAQQKRAEAAKKFEDLATEYSQRFEASVEYINQYQQGLSPYSTINFMINKHPSTGLVLTGNGQIDLYQNPNRVLNQSTFRDAAAAFSLEQRLFRSPFNINSLNEAGVTLTAVGRYQYMSEYSGVPGKKPNIGVFTFKADIPVAAGVSIPLGVSYATSPEDQVLKSSDFVQGNFGLSFDLDKLYTVLKAPQQ